MDNKRVLLIDGGSAMPGAVSQLVRDGGGAGQVPDAITEEGDVVDYKARNEEIDARWVGRIQARMRAADQRKDKDRKGCLRTRYKGGVEEKLRKAFGGKRMRRILGAELRTGKQYPDELRLFEIAQVAVPDGKGGQVNEKHERELVRGVDFALVIDGGAMSLVIDDSVKEFRATSDLNDGTLAGLLSE